MTTASAAFSPREALEAIRSVEGYEDGLRRRTVGLTWMAWGLTGAGINVSYALAGLIVPKDMGWVFALVWIPWMVAGYMMSFALWRSTGLALGDDRDAGHQHFRQRVAVTLGFLAIAWTLGYVLVPAMNEATYPLLMLGSFTLIATIARRKSAFNFGSRPAGIVAGAVIVATALALAAFHVPRLEAGLVGAGIAGTAYLVAGFVLAMQG